MDGTYIHNNPDADPDERTAYREMFAELHRSNRQRQEAGEKALSVGTVHAYVFTPDGRALDSRHVAHAGPASVIEMLQSAVKALGVPAGKPVVEPSPQAPRPACADDAVVLHLVARYLVPRDSAEARKGVEGEFVPLDAGGLGGERSGQWSALPSEDWYVLERGQWTGLLPKGAVAVGDSWRVDDSLADTLLVRFYPTTELNDLGKNRIGERFLKMTALSVEKGRVRARIDGRLRMKHPFYPGRDDDNFVEATVIGTIEFDPSQPRIYSLRIVTDSARYGAGGKGQPFGVAVRLVP